MSSPAELEPHPFQLPLPSIFCYVPPRAVVVVEGAPVRIFLSEAPP